jgi:ABC-2 type transport system ATP-binding protein
MSLEVKALSKSYGTQKAVDSISFSLQKGEIVGFLGPNGAGKSTTMKIITGYLAQDQGEAWVCGVNVEKEPLVTKGKIGYLPEANPLYTDLYVREYLGFVADLHRLSDKKQKVEDMIVTVGLTPESNKKIGQLSKGYKQRVGLAAALIHEPEVLILDEPTSGLDPNQIIEIREVIRNLGRNRTVLFSSHILQEVEALCERVIIINKGRLVADNRLDQLRKGQSGYRVRIQFKEELEPEWLNRLKDVQTVNKTGACQWELETQLPDEVKKQLLELSLQNNLNIVSLQSVNQSLEEIFRSLTN